MTDQPTVQDWFKAALLHDLGKTRGWQTVGGHADWSKTPYASAPELAQIAERAAKHETQVYPHTALDDAAILALADKLQKALYGESAIETGDALPPELDRLSKKIMEPPNFQSYYGAPKVWDRFHRATLESEIAQRLSERPTLANLLQLQYGKLGDYPHTTYVPHLALGVHQQITAVLFFLLWRKVKRASLTTPTDLRDFTFHAFTVTPEPLAFFYRLRYLDAYRETAEKLQTHLFRHLFVSIQGEGLSELLPHANPFQFFHGSSFALMYDDDAQVLQVLQEFLDTSSVPLDALNVTVHSYTLKEWESLRNGAIIPKPQSIERLVREITLVPTASLHFSDHAETRCRYCGHPTTTSELEAVGTINLCDTCVQIERQKGLLNLRAFCADEYLGWVFLSFAAPLLDVAWEQAVEINAEFSNRHFIPPGILHPSATGFDEYFQALAAIQDFQAKCEEQIKNLGKGARRLAHFTHLAIYLLCEDNYWKFLAFLNQERKQLRIPTTLRAFLCHAHFPVWSLMERGAEFDPNRRDLYYHIAQGSVAMFTSTDVNTIRSLATLASAEGITPTLLSSLVNVALRATAPELFLEIDVRAREGKLGRGGFAGKLKDGLSALQADDGFGGREKRAIFIKYIRKLRGEDRR